MERTFTIAQRAMELMKSYGSSASPRSYEVWFTYVAGHKPAMNDAIKRTAADNGRIDDADIDSLHSQFIASERFCEEAEKTGAVVISEIDQVMEMLDLALGSTQKYGESLDAFAADLSGGIDRNRVREIVSALVLATKDVRATNETLEARMRETRGEMEGLRETLEAVRMESLTDPLTGIANRKHFEEMLVKTLDQALVERSPLALIVIDIDHFKRFNDTYGHLTGDQVLRLVKHDHARTGQDQGHARAFRRRGIRDHHARYPTLERRKAGGGAGAHFGDEPRVDQTLDRRVARQGYGLSRRQPACARAITAVSLLERADQCMFIAKRNGRNRNCHRCGSRVSARNMAILFRKWPDRERGSESSTPVECAGPESAGRFAFSTSCLSMPPLVRRQRCAQPD